MEKSNLEKLNTWFELVKGPKNLTIDEARELNKKIRKLPTNRQELQEELILGTMYVIYDFLKNFSFIEDVNTIYDIDDFISSFCEVWIENLEQGLYNQNDLINLFNSRFFDKLNEKLGVSEKNSLFSHIPKIDFDKEFEEFFERQNNGEVISYKKFMEDMEIKHYSDFNSPYKKNRVFYEYTKFYEILDRSYELYSKHGNHNIPFSKGYVKFLRDFLIERVLSDYEDSNNVGYDYDVSKSVIALEKKETIARVIDSLPEKERKVIKMTYGFEGELTQKEIGRSFEENYSGARIGQFEKSALRKLRNPHRRKHLKDYNE
ncbi:MAG: hypothetical protein E7162_04550 [Firmicutes bacterium]|nr:hypothetical protein [Bacillota bacterium]